MYSCSKEKPNVAAGSTASSPLHEHIMSQKTIPATIEEQAGYYHNLYLEAYYNEMQSTIATKGLSNLVAGDFTAGYTASVNDDITGNNAQSLKSLSNSNYTTALGNGDLDDVIDDNIAIVQNSSMNSTLKTYLVNFINDAREIDDYNDMEDFTNDAMTYINSNFQSTNKSIALSAVWVYRYSYTYWNDKADDWRALFDPNHNEPDPAQKIGGYGAADVSGFTGGAVGGAIIGGTATMGTMTAPAWLVGGIAGGIGNSVGAMVADLYSWVVSWF